MRYWLDADTFINANNGPYPILNARSFWKSLTDQVKQGRIVAPKRVFDEVTKGRKKDDALAIWMKLRKTEGLCQKCTLQIDKIATKIGDYVFGGRYQPRHAMEFSKGADPWLIAFAIDDHGTVVTNESKKYANAQKVRIPDVCDHFNVRCITLNELIIEINLQF
ncbi:MAG: DUF4411 family protein [Acidobacteria bacterium]|nr:DUF4411 family protein [Acidobacteriota bacterium]